MTRELTHDPPFYVIVYENGREILNERHDQISVAVTARDGLRKRHPFVVIRDSHFEIVPDEVPQ